MKARTRRPKSGYACWNVPNDGAYRGKTQRILRELRGAYRVRMRGTDSITEFSRRARPLPRLGYNATTPTSGRASSKEMFMQLSTVNAIVTGGASGLGR